MTDPLRDTAEAVVTEPTPADILARAADHLDALIAEVAHGPWAFELLGNGYPQRVVNAEATIVAETFTGPQHRPAEAEWIATMDPAVGRHLVTILRRAAVVYGERGMAEGLLLRLAYAVLGEPMPEAST